ncbi:MAG: GH116 family glycosyl hydrolase [Nanoarchaeota archaeon]|nr:GH116 family glycosyl hydrolase [Nanoarchaeota archaeon]
MKKTKSQRISSTINPIIRQAYEIAKRDLRSNYRKKGIFAGHHQFSDYWARDFSFASFGSAELKDYDVIKHGLEHFINHQKKDGFFPFLIGAKHFLLKYAGFKVHERIPTYGDHKSKSAVVDQNSLLVIAALNYIKKSNDKNFAAKYFENLKRAVDWSLSRDKNKDFLIEERYFANWADSIRKTGKVLYSNVCFYKSVEDFSDLCRICRKHTLSLEYKDLANRIKQKINSEFWNGRYYTDWIENDRKHDFFATDGNVLAIMWNVANKDQATKILKHMEHIKIAYPVPCKTNYPSYPLKYESWLMWFVFLGDYHNNSLAWLWLGCCYAIAQKKAGMKEEAGKIIKQIAEIINKNNMVYEVYEKNGQPVKRTIYKSETHFAWSSGLFVYAVNEIFGKME